MTPTPDRASGSLFKLFGTLLGVLVMIGFFIVLFQTAIQIPGELTVTEIEPGNTTVDENETVTVSVTIENTGESPTTETVELWLGEETQRTSVALDPGETVTLELSDVEADTLSIGDNTYGVTIDDDEVAAVLVVESDRPARFEVTELQPGYRSVSEGELVNVSATIENTGGTAANRSVRLQVDGETFTESRFELDPGESTTYEVFNVGFGFLEPGERTYGVYTADDSATGVVDVPEPVALELRDLEPGDVTVEEAGQIDISATIENNDERAVNRTIELRVDDELRSSQPLELAPGETTDVTFEDIDVPDRGIGAYGYGVSIGAELETRTIVVEGDEPAAFEITSFEPGDVEVEEDGFLNSSATIENTGERAANQTVTFQIDGTERFSTDLGLPPGESEEISLFNIHLAELSTGEYEYGFVTDDDETEATLEIVEETEAAEETEDEAETDD